MNSTGTAPKAAIFDMDGVVTRTARLHAAAWKETLDAFLRDHTREGTPQPPFDEHAEYLACIDGKPREEGIRSFLLARGMTAAPGEQESLAQRKDLVFTRLLRKHGIETYSSTLALIKAMREHAMKTAVVTSSRHGRAILHAAGIAGLFDACLDGMDLAQLGLPGKPDAAMFLAAADLLGIAPALGVIIEDAAAGVTAGRRGCFGLVIGIDRGGNAQALRRAGADLILPDLDGFGINALEEAFRQQAEARAWRIEQEGFDAGRERQMESLFSIGNGYLGVRAAFDCPAPGSQADMFIAGVYDRKQDALPYSEIEFLSPNRDALLHAELVPIPFPFRVSVALANTALDLSSSGRDLRRVLDLHAGVLHAEVVHETPEGRCTLIRTRRCASLVDIHLLLQDIVAAPQNHALAPSISPSLEEPDLAAHHPHLVLVERGTAPDAEWVRYRTRASEIEICIASQSRRSEHALQRLIAVYTSRDTEDPKAAALGHLQSLATCDFDMLLASHTKAWAEFWTRADIRVPGHPDVEQALRFHSYHLRLPAGDDGRTSVGARGLTGRAYEGHVFWDTEIFMLPFHLHVDPPRARSLLLYRHHTLDGARRHAVELGCRGACYAWESTDNGRNVTPKSILLRSSGKEIPIFTGEQQIHVTADVAYAVWRYWEATGDEEFLTGAGAEILYETARFWQSRISRGARHCHIRGVVGPDEYHYGVNDNAYTNWMARFNLERAAWLARERGDNLAEAEDWKGIAQSLYVPAPNEAGVIEQFEGFFALEDYALPGEDRFKAPLSRLFDWDRINRVKLIKQADVLMLPLLFPDAFTDAEVAANYRYYEPLTDHGSSLSPPVHAAIAARIGLAEDAQRYWRQSLWLDLSNAMNNSMLGMHLGAMGATWQALVFGLLGVRFRDAGPTSAQNTASHLMPGWDSVALRLCWRGRWHALRVPGANELES
ncbi:HAD family hydrolase [Noviherbaspirillum pedocola]|uniref:HAD hydrolase-like protein n=1 Tax=Noviherbaspirillum pedocola TaxID=2801341 RepID=A0A934SVK7_9BURK|nr:HAD family hydrolase [Noviherbaspirillum pedocola]MBK4737626.1 HAD hydrolase-like protein [Noviherbaspirillum pedocola]